MSVRIPDYPSSDAEKWSHVDSWFAEKLVKDDERLAFALANNADCGLPEHDVSALQGKFLSLLVKMSRATRILEIGTLGGYSTIWLAKALPEGGHVTTIEFNEHHADVARRNIENAGLDDRIDIHTGAALDVLPTLTPFYDLIFIDADKANNPNYLEWALKLSRPGSVIVGDNVVRGGGVVDPESSDPNVNGLRNFVQMISEDERLEATAIQTVGEKGWDGFLIALVISP